MSSNKRARWDGSSPTTIYWPPGEVYPEKTWTVEPNHLLPEDAPAALRDELVTRDNWTEVAHTAPGEKKDKGE